MERAAYPSDLTDEQWKRILAAIPPARNGRTGRPRQYPLREVWNAIFYQARNGCSRRSLPRDFPPYNIVWDHFWRWRNSGLVTTVHDALRESVRKEAGKEPTPRVAIIDSQSLRPRKKGGQRC
jgi:putative transposase